MNYIGEKKVWIKTDGWRGYAQPINAVGGCNHTGSWSDSPCPTNEVQSEIESFRKKLRKEGIRSKLLSCVTSNVFCQHVYVLVHPQDKERAYKIAEVHENETRLFYSVK